MKLAVWLAAIGVAGTALANAAEAREDAFIERPTRIKGCVAIIDEVRKGVIEPTAWLEQNKEEFQDLSLELKKRNFSESKAKQYMYGSAITVCMENKGYINTCVTGPVGEDRDVKTMETAAIYACWKRASVEPPQRREDVVEPPRPPQPPRIYLTPADQAMLNEDLAIVTQPVRIIGDHENGAKEARLSQCGGYWNDRLHYNRSQEARNLLWAVRVWRCMFRTSYTVFTQRCPGVTLVATQGWGPALYELQRPHCYARYG